MQRIKDYKGTLALYNRIMGQITPYCGAPQIVKDVMRDLVPPSCVFRSEEEVNNIVKEVYDECVRREGPYVVTAENYRKWVEAAEKKAECEVAAVCIPRKEATELARLACGDSVLKLGGWAEKINLCFSISIPKVVLTTADSRQWTPAGEGQVTQLLKPAL